MINYYHFLFLLQKNGFLDHIILNKLYLILNTYYHNKKLYFLEYL